MRALARAHEVHVLTLRYPHRPPTYRVYGAHVQALGGGMGGGYRRAPLLARALLSLHREAQRAPFDVLHGLWADEAGFVAAMAGRWLRTPAVVSLMGGELVGFADIDYGVQLSRSGRRLAQLALRLATGVTAGSRLLQAQAAQHVTPQRLHPLPLGVDTTLFAPAPPGAASHPLRVLHVASLSPVKEQATLLDAFALVARALPGATLHVAGDGPLRPALQQRAHAPDLAGKVHFLGAVPHDELPNHYRAATLFALSSRYESQNMAVLEAAACGLPAVGTAVGILPDLLPPDCLAPAGDPAALAQAMQRLLQDEARRAAVAQQVQAAVEQRYALARTVPALLHLYRSLA